MSFKPMTDTIIRPAIPADLPEINAIFNYYVAHSTSVWTTTPCAEAERKAWYQEHDERMPVLVAECAGRIVGWGSLGTFREAYTSAGTVEDSIYVHHESHRRGIGSALLKALIAAARKNGYRSILAHISGEQEASIRLHEKFGFRKVGHFTQVGWKFNQWRDAVFLQLPLADKDAGDGQPCPEAETGRVVVQPVEEADRPWIGQLLTQHWSSPRIVTRSRVHQADQLPGFVAWLNGERMSLVTYRIADESCEIVSLNSLRERKGVGTSLIWAVRDVAAKQGCTRVWLITTNDNTAALRFYQRRGFVVAAIHRNALEDSRKLKPEIPLRGADGIPLRDEIELEMALPPGQGAQSPAAESSELASGRIVLRSMTLDDAECVVRWKSDPFVKRMALGRNTEVTLENQREDIRRALSSTEEIYWMLLIKETRQPIGYIRVNWMEKAHYCAWLRFAMGEHRGEGLAREGLSCALGELFRKGAHRIETEAYAFNDRSMGLLERLGFKREGIKREAHWDGDHFADIIVYGLLREDWRT